MKKQSVLAEIHIFYLINYRVFIKLVENKEVSKQNPAVKDKEEQSCVVE